MKKILIVDDMPDIIMLMSAVLKRSIKCVVITSNSVDHAVAIIRDSEIAFDLVISDFEISNGGGGELVIAAVKARSGHTKTIVASGAMLRIGEKIRKACPADRFLEKPYQIGELRTLVKDLLEIHTPAVV